MALLEEAGLPPGVINMVTGDGIAVSDVALADPDLAGIHFTGSTRVFQLVLVAGGREHRRLPLVPPDRRRDRWQGLRRWRTPAPTSTYCGRRMVRGAFEYQGQKCSAASRAYVPRSLWDRLRDDLAAEVDGLTMGPTTDLSNFMGAVIDDRAFGRLSKALDRAGDTDSISVLAGGTCDDSDGWFVRPTVLVGTDPTDEIFTTEYFGPILAVHVYEDGDYLTHARGRWSRPRRTPLTGSIDRPGPRRRSPRRCSELRFAAGNFYINDKPTGAVVGQQPFGGGRASGTNDKAGSPPEPAALDLHPVDQGDVRVPPRASRHPHQG